MSFTSSYESVVSVPTLDADQKRKRCWRHFLWAVTTAVVFVPFVMIAFVSIQRKKKQALVKTTMTEMAHPLEYYRARFDKYRQKIELLSPTSFALLQPDSPQARAFEWLVFRDETLSHDTAEPHDDFATRFALMVLFYACGGEVWLGAPLDERIHMSTCDWTDLVECNTENIITVLKGTGFGMIGELPPEIGLLSTLTALRLGSNLIEGTLPEDIYNNLSNLEIFDISNNRFVGSIPKGIGKLTSLVEMNFGSNLFVGAPPNELQALSKLEKVTFHNMDLTGDFFGDFAASYWPHLRSLSIEGTKLSGRLQINRNWSTSLEYLHLRRNRFTGPLPSTAQNLTNLSVLVLSLNQFTGDMVDLSQLTKLQEFRLEEQVGGTITTGIRNLQLLKNLEILDAPLMGTIPTELGDCHALQLVTLLGTGLAGSIPSEIGQLAALRFFSVENSNQLTGSIPSALCELKKSPAFQMRYPCERISCDCCALRECQP